MYYNFSGMSGRMLAFSLLFLAAIIVYILARVLIAFAVNEDAKAIGVKNKTLWVVLTLFFPICAFIYLGVRKTLEKTVPRLCIQCGETMPPNTRVCLNCSSPALLDYRITGEEIHKKHRKTYLIAGIVCFLVGFVASQIAVGGMAVEIYTRQRNNNGNGYNDYFNYFDDFGKYFEQYGLPDEDENSGNDSNDFFDDFNNFGSGGSEEGEGGEENGDDMYDFFNEFGN